MNEKEAVETDAEAMRTYREDAVLLLRSVRSSLAGLLRRIVEGESGALKELVAKQAELESALKRAFEAETRYNEWIARDRGGPDPAGEIDLDAARAEIGCRLHRLRSCCQTE